MNSTGIRVRALYDFQAQPGSGELSIIAGELITVTRQDIGEGWWEGINSRSECGLFPAGYVEPCEQSPPVPQHPPPQPPILQPTPVVSSNNNATDADDIGWGEDDWDDDDSQTSTNAGDYVQTTTNSIHTMPVHSTLSLPAPSGGGAGGHSAKGQASMKRSYNRFSTFVKSGGEDYILGTKNKSAPSDCCVNVIDTPDGNIVWAPNSNRYNCMIASPKKETKLKGLKKFIAYQLTPTFNNVQVSRRYKHFDWLHGRMEEKFISIPIPPLPDKQIAGRYQEAFIDHRMAQLQLWVNRICRHPVLSQCDVWLHFITCTSDEKRWKAGKRRAERDEFVGANFFFAIKTPKMPLEPAVVEKHTDHFGKFVMKMDEAVKTLHLVAQDELKKYVGPYKKDFTRVGSALQQLAAAFDLSGHEDNSGLTSAIRHTGDTYECIAKMFEEQPKHDFEPLSDILYEYKGMLASWPDILQIHKGAVQRKRENIKLKEEGKIEANVAESVAQRADVVSYATLAEISHFHEERNSDFNEVMKGFLNSQIQFYQNVVAKLQETLAMYQ